MLNEVFGGGFFIFLCASVSACNPSQEGVLRTRSAFDLSCNREVRMTIIEKYGAMDCVGSDWSCARTVGAEGCGKKATYVRAPDGTWVMNGSQQPAS
jgi:hypothetical protein